MSLVDQVRQLEEKIRLALEGAKALKVENARLEKELAASRSRVQELEPLATRSRTLADENQDLVKERDEVRRHVDAMLSALGEIEAAARG